MKRVSFCATKTILQEPRFRRYALGFARCNPGTTVIVVDCAPTPISEADSSICSDTPHVSFRRAIFAVRSLGVVKLVIAKAKSSFARLIFRLFGHDPAGMLSTRSAPLLKELKCVEANVFCVYTIDAPLPASIRAEEVGARVVVDSVEYHADMGDGLTATEHAVIDKLLRDFLPRCTLILASSEVQAERLQSEYRVREVVARYNCPRRTAVIQKAAQPRLRLYWRNSVVALGQQGLAVLLQALTRLPEDVVLTLRGRLPLDGGEHVFRKVADLGLASRVTVLPSHPVEDGVNAAQPYDVGVFPESAGPLNHDIILSNKMFDSFAAGLAVVSLDIRGLRVVIEASGAGLLFVPDDSDALADEVLAPHHDRPMLAKLSAHAASYHLASANCESQFERFHREIHARCGAGSSR